MRLDGTAGRRYEIQTSDDLVRWSPGEIQTPVVDSELVFTLPVTDPTTFVRVESAPTP